MPNLTIWKILLVMVAAVWGIGFPLTKDTLVDIPVFSFLSIRFGIAALCFLPWIVQAIHHPKLKRDLIFGFGVGVPLAVGYCLQTAGLEKTSVTHAAFLTGLYSIFTPILDWALYRTKPSKKIILACFVAVVGLWFISGVSDFHLSFGDFLVVLCAFSFSFQMVWLSHTPEGSSSTTLAFAQLASVSLLTLPTMILIDKPDLQNISLISWSSILFLAVIGSSAAFYIQTKAQKFIPPTQVALLILTEPVWGAIAGAVMSNERLPLHSYIGGLLLLSAVIITEYRPPAKKSRSA